MTVSPPLCSTLISAPPVSKLVFKACCLPLHTPACLCLNCLAPSSLRLVKPGVPWDLNTGPSLVAGC